MERFELEISEVYVYCHGGMGWPRYSYSRHPKKPEPTMYSHGSFFGDQPYNDYGVVKLVGRIIKSAPDYIVMECHNSISIEFAWIPRNRMPSQKQIDQIVESYNKRAQNKNGI